MEMNFINIPDINAVQQFNTTSVSSSEGDTHLCESGESRFAAIVNKEINNNGGNNEPGKSEIVSASNVQDVTGHKNDSGKSEKESGSDNQDIKGLKIYNLILNMLGSSVTANTNGLPVNLINEIDDSEVTEETFQQLINQMDQTMPAEKDLLAALINRIKDQKITEEALQQLKNQQDQNMPADNGLLAALINQIEDKEITEEAPPQLNNHQDQNTPAENGLKTGALLYAMTNNVINPAGDSPADLINQSSSDTMPKGETFTGKIKDDPDNGLKAGIVFTGFNNDNKITEDTIEGKENPLNIPAQNDSNKTASDSSKLSVLEKLLERVDKNNKNELNHLKSAHERQDLTKPGLAENNSNSRNIQGGLLLEASKEISKTEGLKNYPDNFIKTVKVESTSDNTNLLNHSGIKLESGKLAEAISSGNAPKPSVSNQVLDNIVYVIKGNNKMGVSLEHDILGKLNINLSMEKGMLNVHINTSEKTAREFIENNIQYIVDSLAKDGLSVGGFSVGLKNHNDHEGNVFIMNNRQESQEQQVINEKAKISAINGLVSVFA